ncbi:hypothetical protein PLICRDRAFT_48715 [Plicaturopsis crispa FD-325 SS-3]|nr:hypothetical protein PLICRDRAFT_48715 [Plicaturopsis crispa FD-325 SS-3]
MGSLSHAWPPRHCSVDPKKRLHSGHKSPYQDLRMPYLSVWGLRLQLAAIDQRLSVRPNIIQCLLSKADIHWWSIMGRVFAALKGCFGRRKDRCECCFCESAEYSRKNDLDTLYAWPDADDIASKPASLTSLGGTSAGRSDSQVSVETGRRPTEPLHTQGSERRKSSCDSDYIVGIRGAKVVSLRLREGSSTRNASE